MSYSDFHFLPDSVLGCMFLRIYSFCSGCLVSYQIVFIVASCEHSYFLWHQCHFPLWFSWLASFIFLVRIAKSLSIWAIFLQDQLLVLVIFAAVFVFSISSFSTLTFIISLISSSLLPWGRNLGLFKIYYLEVVIYSYKHLSYNCICCIPYVLVCCVFMFICANILC